MKGKLSQNTLFETNKIVKTHTCKPFSLPPSEENHTLSIGLRQAKYLPSKIVLWYDAGDLIIIELFRK